MKEDRRPWALVTDMPSPQDGEPRAQESHPAAVRPGCIHDTLHGKLSPHPPPPVSSSSDSAPSARPSSGPQPARSSVGLGPSYGSCTAFRRGRSMLAPPQPRPRPHAQDTSMAPQKATFWTPGWAASTGSQGGRAADHIEDSWEWGLAPLPAGPGGGARAGGARTTTVQPGGSRQLKQEESRLPALLPQTQGSRHPAPPPSDPGVQTPLTTYLTASAGQILHIMSRKGEGGGQDETNHSCRNKGDWAQAPGAGRGGEG